MVLEWNPWVVPGTLASLLSFAAAAVVFAAGPGRSVNRAAGVVLVIDGVHILSSGAFAWVVVADPAAAFGAALLHFLLDVAEIPVYLWFVGCALDTPLARPFRDRRVLALFSVPALVFAILIAVAPTAVASVFLVDHWYWSFGADVRWPVVLILVAQAVALFYTLVAAIHAWRRARSPIQRQQAKAYVLAFGIRDLGMGTASFFAFLWLGGLLGTRVLDILGWAFAFMAVCVVLYPLALVYGILRHQLFDIDLRIKAGLRRSTVAAAFLVTFFVVSEAIEAFVSGRAGVWGGVAAAALLAFALRPLETGAARFADRLMPSVQDTRTYREARALDVYRSAISDAMVDGQVSERERAILAGLRRNLGIDAGVADHVERELLGGTGVA